LRKNTQINSQKANFLLFAYRAFIAGTIGVGLLSIFLISAGYALPKPQPTAVSIEKPVTIQGLNSTLDQMKGRPPVIIHDTVYLKK
jgi:hypothetical protein